MSEFSSLAEQLQFMIYGLSLVIGVLALLWGVCNLNYLVARFLTRRNSSKELEKIPAAPLADLQATVAGPESRLVAILTAAATEALGKSVRVVRFDPSLVNNMNWTLQGRAVHHWSRRRPGGLQ